MTGWLFVTVRHFRAANSLFLLCSTPLNELKFPFLSVRLYSSPADDDNSSNMQAAAHTHILFSFLFPP
jgi:hypothetical protein